MSSNAAAPVRVAIAGGGTGGHLFPGIAVGEELRTRGGEVTLLVSPKEVDQQAVKLAEGFSIATLPAVAWQPGNRLGFFRGFWRSLQAAKKLFLEQRPDAVLAMGGFTSAPPICAARRMGIPTFLHESNFIPGRANRWLARWVDEAFVGFSQSEGRLAAREVTITGTPVRHGFQSHPAAACREALGLESTRPVMLVMGGSQGATGINEVTLNTLSLLARHALQWQWLHLTGPTDFEKVQAAYRRHGLKSLVRKFLPEMDLALGAATACVSRAGASSLAELAAMQLPALLIPYPSAADDHQWYNARAFEETGAAILLRQSECTPERVAGLMRELMEDSVERAHLKKALVRWHAPRAAGMIVDRMLHAIGRSVLQVESPEVVPMLSREQSPNRTELKSAPIA